MPDTVNEKLLHGQIKHSIYIERYKTQVLKDILKELKISEDDLVATIAARMTKINGRGYDLGPASTTRLKTLLKEIKEKQIATYKVLENRLSGELDDFAHYEADFQIKLSDQSGVTHDMIMPSNPQLKAIVESQPFEGGILSDWMTKAGLDAAQRVQAAIRTGMTQSETLDQIVRRIKGSKALQYTDGILETNRRNIAAIVRTSVNHVQNRAKIETFNANADIIHKVQFIATLDSSTTPYCQVHDNRIYDLGEEPPLPAHWGCRSTYVAYFEGDETGTRASINGPIPANISYEQFLRDQSKEFQDEVLGIARAEKFRAGEALGKFVDSSGKYYTLDQLRERGI